MKSRKSILAIGTVVLATISMSANVAAQDSRAQANGPAQHHHYQLIDMGTFGGPMSYVPETIAFENAASALSSWGLVGASATSIGTTGTSNPLVCGGVPFVFHAFEWHRDNVTDLGALPGQENCSYGAGINATGVIVGASENGQIDPLTGVNQSRAIIWTRGQIADLGSFGGNQNGANSVNSHGQVVGFSLNTIPDPYSILDGLLLGYPNNGTQTRGFLWQHGVMQDLGTLGGFDALPYLLNERGQIAGASYTNSTPNPSTGVPTLDPFLWENGEMVDLGTLGGTQGFPLSLNSRGQVVGTSNLSGDQTAHPFLWDRGVLRDLGTLGGSFGNANAINEQGAVVGYASNTGDQAVLAFLWMRGVITSLGTLGSDPCSTANSVNSNNQVVGISTATCDFSTGRRAFIWENGAMVDLNTLIPPGSGIQLTAAETINDRGEIAINGTPSGCGMYEQCGHAVLLIPCDELHPGIEGCDYSMVEGNTAATPIKPAPTQESSTRNQIAPAFGRAANPMARRFGRGLGPWYRGFPGQTPNSTLTSPHPVSTSEAGTPACPGMDASKAWGRRHGYCEVFDGRLGGVCLAVAPCQSGTSFACSPALPVLRPYPEVCIGEVEVDRARFCSF